MPVKRRWGKSKDAKEQQRRHNIDLADAVCVQIENWIESSECERYMEILQNEIEWKKQEITVFQRDGRAIKRFEPRLTQFMASPGVCYEYSKRDNVGSGWHPAIFELKEKAEQACLLCGLEPVTFNAAQMNRYEGPRHSLGMHADNEPDLVPCAPIASVSFGVTREFRIMRRDDESLKWSLGLSDGCFMVMGGEMQRHYLHGVPAGDEPGLRFNITFRCCIPRAPLNVWKRYATEERCVPLPAQRSSALVPRLSAEGKGRQNRFRRREQSSVSLSPLVFGSSAAAFSELVSKSGERFRCDGALHD